MLAWLRDLLFPKILMIPLERDSEGYLIGFGGARRHKTVRKDNDEYTFRVHYVASNPFNRRGRESDAFPPLHFHRQQEEWFKIIQGRLGYVLDGKEGMASAGEVVHLPKGRIHTFWCDPLNEEDTIAEFTARPGKRMDNEVIDSAYGIFNSHYVAGKPVSFLQMMVIWDEAASAPGHLPVPNSIAVLMTHIFGRYIGRLAGYKGMHPIYTDSMTVKK